jgi:hypothetical protein
VSHQIRSIVEHAESVRTARYVERVQVNQDGIAQYFEKTRQRGLSFGTPDAFRAAVAQKTRAKYVGRGMWGQWTMSVGVNEAAELSVEEVERMSKEYAQRVSDGEGVSGSDR